MFGRFGRLGVWAVGRVRKGVYLAWACEFDYHRTLKYDTQQPGTAHPHAHTRTCMHVRVYTHRRVGGGGGSPWVLLVLLEVAKPVVADHGDGVENAELAQRAGYGEELDVADEGEGETDEEGKELGRPGNAVAHARSSSSSSSSRAGV